MLPDFIEKGIDHLLSKLSLTGLGSANADVGMGRGRSESSSVSFLDATRR